MLTGIVLLITIQGMAGCSSSTAPSPVPQRPAIPLVTFYDQASGFSTTDLRDAQEQILQFSPFGEFIWVETGARFPGYGGAGGSRYISGPQVGLEIHFASKDGQRRAYLMFLDDIHYPGPLADAEVVDGKLIFTGTDELVPGT